MSSSGYTSWAVTAGEMPTTAYWNILGSNDASFNTGTGFNDGIIQTRHIATGIATAQLQLNPYKFSAYLSTNASYTDSSTNTIIFNTELFDTNANYDNTTGIFVAPVAGFYQYNVAVFIQGQGASVPLYWEGWVRLRLNGSTEVDFSDIYFYTQTQFTSWSARMSGIIQLSANDNLRVAVMGDTAGGQNTVVAGGRNQTRFDTYLVSAT